jgi:hypothetical protein
MLKLITRRVIVREAAVAGPGDNAVINDAVNAVASIHRIDEAERRFTVASSGRVCRP